MAAARDPFSGNDFACFQAAFEASPFGMAIVDVATDACSLTGQDGPLPEPGARFTVLLPLAPAAARTPQEAASG